MKYLMLLPLSLISVFGADSSKILFEKECSACHMAYQPQFLPKRSWVKMMDTLSNHFSSDASLSKEDTQKITEYLVNNASDSNNKAYGHIAKFANSIPSSQTLLAISETPKFKKEHRKIPNRFIEQEAVKSLSNCAACHTTAQKGFYDERSIKIPNYGRWDD